MRFLHTLDPDELREINDNEDLARAMEILKEDEMMERKYYSKKDND